MKHICTKFISDRKRKIFSTANELMGRQKPFSQGVRNNEDSLDKQYLSQSHQLLSSSDYE